MAGGHGGIDPGGDNRAARRCSPVLGVIRALNRGYVREFDASRNNTHWGKTETTARPVMGLTNARKQMTRFSTFILAVVMISGGVSFAFAQQAQPRYVVSPFAPFFNFGNRSSGPIPRTVVDFQSSYAPGTIFIDTTERRLYLVIGRSQAIRYGIGVGRDGYGWAGALRISAKREWPNWFPPVEMLARRPDLPRFMPGGLDNPLGARALYLGSTLYRIHGSNEPETIGQAVSSGCFRMTNDDVIDLYNRVSVGATVIVR
jgi:lipoprotein-anchoring transpeptidase ErfK/SrfK